MRKQSQLKVMPRKESSANPSGTSHELGPVSNFERSVMSTLNEMERMFEETMHRPFFGYNWQPFRHVFQGLGSFGEFSPAVDIFDEGNHIVVKSELPGLTKDDINVELLGNTLSISGEKRAEEKIDRKGYFRLERSHGAFRRNLSLPEGVEYGKARAEFKNGILEVRIPKAGEKGTTRRITIE